MAALIAAAMPATPWAQPAAERSARVIPVDRIVAVVNNDVITRIALDEHLRLVGDGLRRDGAPPPPRDVLEKQVLERMINQRVQLQFAADVGLRIDDSQLDRTIERIAQDNKLTVAGLRSALQKDGVPFSRFREDIRREMTIARLREREVDSKIVITEGEVDGYLQTASNVKAPANEYNLAHILVQVPEQASPEQIRARLARAEEAMEKIRGGADFRQVSASYSDAPEALQGGALGWRPADRLPTLFVDAVKSMRVGDVSPVLRSSNGFHILKLLDQRGSAPVIVQQTQARHILLKTNEIISETEARNRLLGLRERIENGAADFAELARLHSQDGSAARGGDLGWLSPGDTVPAFERAMNQLKPGQLSQPVKTEFGWHLIQVLARRDEDMSKERQRLLARQALRNRKSDEAYQEWVRQLRDKAYVEIKRERE
ncbi:MAG: peptidylprolyl isomerase [Vicinamibacterales bacterium]